MSLPTAAEPTVANLIAVMAWEMLEKLAISDPQTVLNITTRLWVWLLNVVPWLVSFPNVVTVLLILVKNVTIQTTPTVMAVHLLAAGSVEMVDAIALPKSVMMVLSMLTPLMLVVWIVVSPFVATVLWTVVNNVTQHREETVMGNAEKDVLFLIVEMDSWIPFSVRNVTMAETIMISLLVLVLALPLASWMIATHAAAHDQPLLLARLMQLPQFTHTRVHWPRLLALKV
jgi:hypothetical protein